jgi:hypothetical protein
VARHIPEKLHQRNVSISGFAETVLWSRRADEGEGNASSRPLEKNCT